MSWSMQVATWTSNNRYPGVFRTVQDRIRRTIGPDLGSGRLRLLSFGCSTGNEIAALRSYFPDATIFGCDVNQEAMKEARRALQFDDAHVFESSPENIAKHGPYDAIFAMSVFCRFPESQDLRLENARSLYPFDTFADGIGRLTDGLKETGLLCLFNTNYAFSDSVVAKDFVPIRSPLIGGNGFVDRFLADGRRLTRCEMVGQHYVHRLAGTIADASASDFLTCIYERRAAQRPADEARGVSAAAPECEPPPGRPDIFRFGPDLDDCAGRRLRATALGYWFRSAGAGSRLTRAWFRSTFDGQIEQGPAWTVDVDPSTETLLRREVAREAEPVAADRAGSGAVLGNLRHLARRTRDFGQRRFWGANP